MHGPEANRQSRNLGPALVRLVSTDIRMIRGSAYISRPSGIDRWGNSDSGSSKWQNSYAADTGGYTDYITTITPVTGPGEARVFLLKAHDARDRETNARNSGVIVGLLRPTLHGLAADYRVR